MSVKVQFLIACEASPVDSKTSVKNFKSIQVLGESVVYSFLPTDQPSAMHPELSKHPTIEQALKQLDKRGKTRNVKITLEDALRKIYVDDDGNVIFRKIFLDEISPLVSYDTTLNKESPVQTRSFTSLTKEMVCQKFSDRQNANQWISLFEKESVRMTLPQHRFAEALRLFLDGPALDWYDINLKIIGLEGSWSSWKISFLENFDSKGWSEIVYAYTFKYMVGPFTDYALKKIKLLLDVESSLPTTARINLVVVGLPGSVRERLVRSDIETQGDLMAALGALEHLATKFSEKTGKQGEGKKPFGKKPFKPCSFCEKLGQKNRFHPEAKCWNNPDNPENRLNSQKQASSKFLQNKPVRVVNNIELQDVINETIPNKKN